MPFTFQFQLFCYDTAGFFGCECLFRNVEVGSTHTHYQGIILLLIHHHCFCGQERENIIGSRFGILYPAHLSMEQCSSEVTANYKVKIVSDTEYGSRKTFTDLTGGFGIDCAFLSAVTSEEHCSMERCAG